MTLFLLPPPSNLFSNKDASLHSELNFLSRSLIHRSWKKCFCRKFFRFRSKQEEKSFFITQNDNKFLYFCQKAKEISSTSLFLFLFSKQISSIRIVKNFARELLVFALWRAFRETHSGSCLMRKKAKDEKNLLTFLHWEWRRKNRTQIILNKINRRN